MRFKSKNIEYIEKLARIKLNEEEKKEIAEQLSRVLDYINKLNEIDTKGIEINSFFQKNKQNVFRKDRVRKSLSSQEALKNAPQKQGDFFKVPRVIENS